MKKLSKNKVLLLIAALLMIVSMLGASCVQSSFGKVKVSDVKWINSQGLAMTGLLLVPETATAANPAPAVICCHGFLNNKEMQDLNFVELARRGYVVLTVDMPSHGNSDIGSGVPNMMNSVHESVMFLKGISYVNNTQIGVTGHSFGSFSCNFAARSDVENHIAAVLVNSMNPTTTGADGSFANVYGSRNVGVIAGLYDEFAFTITGPDGKELPRPDYIHSADAQSFLYFGQDPAGKEERTHDTVYTDTVDGKECIRVIYTPNITHPWSHFSKRSTTATISFFQQALPAPNPIEPTNQVWQWKVFFNAMGLVGMALFIVGVTIAFINMPAFAVLKAEEEPKPLTLAGGKSMMWFWVSLLIGAVYGGASYLPVMQLANSANFTPTLLGQSAIFGISMWAIGCAVVSIICMVLGRKLFGGSGELMPCLKLSGIKIVKTIELAIVVCFLTFLWVFMANYLFHVDFRIWTLAAKPFNSTIFGISIPYMLLLCVFYITNSVAINCFNYNTIGKKTGNILILAVANLLPCAIVVTLQYTHFFSTGILRWSGNQTHLMVVWLYPLFVMLPASAIISRAIFKKTGNPYLPGIINAIIIALMSCANTCTFK